MRGWSVSRGIALAVFLLLACVGLAQAGTRDAVVHGEYLVHAADCMPCHSGPGQSAFSGGLAIDTPFGRMVSPNITPDEGTGIGLWTDDQFYRVIHDGVAPGGRFIYPTMPFTSYTKMTRQDALDIKAYLFSLKPVAARRDVNQLRFPFDIRLSLIGWRILFFQAGRYQADPTRSAVWNRGAYLVQGPGHCGECHSPRNGLGAMLLGRSLSGGIVDNYYAPNISTDPVAGLGRRTVAQISQFLRTGAEPHLGVAFGPMAEVVRYSTSALTDADLTAIATYLLGAERRPDYATPIPILPAERAAGRALYASNCALCHQPNGGGIPNAIPNLAGNAAVTASLPNSVIAPMINGLAGGGGYGMMPSFAGALSDGEIAAIANYVRTSWGNRASANATPALVARLRQVAGRG